jgi:hypothetical protein
MNYKMVTIFALLLQTSVCTLAAQNVTANKHVSSKDLKQEATQAQTADQLHALAETYRREESMFKTDAQRENEELARRIAQTGGRTLKYPSPVDSARYLSQYYTAKADEMGSKASLFEAQAASKR